MDPQLIDQGALFFKDDDGATINLNGNNYRARVTDFVTIIDVKMT